MHFHAYLLDGTARWNEDRAKQAVKTDTTVSSSYSSLLRHAVNELSERVMDEKLVPEFQPPRKYTGNFSYYSIAAMYTLENVVVLCIFTSGGT